MYEAKCPVCREMTEVCEMDTFGNPSIDENLLNLQCEHCEARVQVTWMPELSTEDEDEDIDTSKHDILPQTPDDYRKGLVVGWLAGTCSAIWHLKLDDGWAEELLRCWLDSALKGHPGREEEIVELYLWHLDAMRQGGQSDMAEKIDRLWKKILHQDIQGTSR